MPAVPPTIAELRDQLRVIEGDGRREHPVPGFGVEAIDARLAAAGLRLDALHEAAGEGAGWGDDAAALLFLAGIAARAQGPVLWVVRARDLFAPGLYQAGLDPARVLYAEARDDAELLAVMEEGLRHRGLGAVIGEARRVATAATRRLQLAAEGGRAPALLLRRPARDGADVFGLPSAAVKRYGSPEVITTHGLKSYGAALRELGGLGKQEVGRHANNQVENSHLPVRRRERAMSRFRRMKTLQKFASAHVNVHNPSTSNVMLASTTGIELCATGWVFSSELQKS